MEGFHKYKKIYRLGHEETEGIFSDPEDNIVMQEKIDGANFRFAILKGKLVFGSRTQQLTSDEGEDTNVAKNFAGCVKYIRDIINKGVLSDYEGYIFYGEACHKHTMSYNWDKIPRYLGFDVLEIETNEFMPKHFVDRAFAELGLETVPYLGTVKAKELTEINDASVPVSAYAPKENPEQQAEGVVYKNYDKQLMGKYVRDEFKERNAETFGGRPKYNKEADTDNSEFIFKYCTNERIEKLIFKKVDQGEVLDMKMMGSLIKETYLDIIEEEWKEILTSNWKIDFKGVRKKIGPRVRSVLNQIITNNALN